MFNFFNKSLKFLVLFSRNLFINTITRYLSKYNEIIKCVTLIIFIVENYGCRIRNRDFVNCFTLLVDLEYKNTWKITRKKIFNQR